MTTFIITIDGREVPARSGQTILQVCRENGIAVPVLCYEPRLSPLGTCRLCTVEVEGPGLTISCSTMAAEGMVVRTRSESVLATRKARVEQLVADHYGDCLAPCRLACPAGIDIQGYIALVARGAYREAVDLVRESIPLPAVCGRICPHPCEKACQRSLVDDPIAINQLKRFAAEQGQGATGREARCLDAVKSPLPPQRERARVRAPQGGGFLGQPDACATHPPQLSAPPTGFRVAVVGSGPAGLAAAYFLARAGHAVTIFEARGLAGGMLRYGIPAYRLPKDILDREIASVLSLGITLRTGRQLGKDFSLAGLRSGGFQAVFLATGAGHSIPLDVPGADRNGVFSGMALLAGTASGNPPHIGQRVAVIGGGNTAVDAARTALRLGAAAVTVIYRRSREEMPAIAAEVADAEHEGIGFLFYAAPIQIKGAGGGGDKLICQKMAPGRPGAPGRPLPEPVPGSDFSLPIDSVIIATGQQPDLSWLASENQADRLRSPRGTVLADPETMATGIAGVFAGGDAVTGPATAIEAMAAGKKAAIAIDRFLQATSAPQTGPFNSAKGRLDEIDKAAFANIAAQPRQPVSELAPEARRRNFNEVAAGYDEAAARAEAGRCLQCGCSAIDKCTLRSLATEFAIPAPSPKKDRYIFPVDKSNPFVTRDDNKCVLCGVCARTCRELIGAGALPTNFRVADGAAMTPLVKTTCITCGECTVVCPVGAMSPAAELKPERETVTICPYCSAGCAVKVGVRGDLIVSARGDPEGPANHGLLCFRGRFGWGFVNHSARLTRPLVKKNGQLVPAPWDKALDIVAGKLAAHRGDRSAVMVSAKILNEEVYILHQFARAVMGARRIAHTAMARQTPGPAVLPGQLGESCRKPVFPDLTRCACLLVAGADLSISYPVLWHNLRRAAQNGAYLMVIDPRETEPARTANLWLNPRPGTAAALIAGMIQAMVQENLLDPELTAGYGEDFGRLQASIAGMTPARAEQVTGVSADRITEAAYAFAQQKPAAIIYGSGISARKNGTEAVKALVDLAALTGNAGPGGGVFPLAGQNNIYGAMAAGKDCPDLLATLQNGETKALYVVGANPAVSQGPAFGEALKKLDFLVVQDLFLTETAALADVVLPAASLAEKEGAVTNLQGITQAVHRVLRPIGEAREDWRIACDLARRLEVRGFDFATSADIAQEMAAAAATSFLSPAGKPRLWPLSPDLPVDTASGIQFNHLYHFNTRTMTGHIPGIEKLPEK